MRGNLRALAMGAAAAVCAIAPALGGCGEVETSSSVEALTRCSTAGACAVRAPKVSGVWAGAIVDRATGAQRAVLGLVVDGQDDGRFRGRMRIDGPITTQRLGKPLDLVFRAVVAGGARRVHIDARGQVPTSVVGKGTVALTFVGSYRERPLATNPASGGSERGADAPAGTESSDVDIKLLQKDVLEAVERQLDLINQRQGDPDGGNIWW